jgi:hypothetical protein
MKYEVGQRYSVENADTNPDTPCGAGINVATLDWILKEYKGQQDANDGDKLRVLIVEFTANDIASIPTNTDGKLRLFRCKVVGEKTLEELGLVEEAKEKEVAKS